MVSSLQDMLMLPEITEVSFMRVNNVGKPLFLPQKTRWSQGSRI